MASVYSMAWIFLRAFPVIIGKTDNLHVYGVITLLVEMNSMTNALVYLINNGEIKKSIRKMIGYLPSMHSSLGNTLMLVGNGR